MLKSLTEASKQVIEKLIKNPLKSLAKATYIDPPRIPNNPADQHRSMTGIDEHNRTSNDEPIEQQFPSIDNSIPEVKDGRIQQQKEYEKHIPGTAK